ncbi:MAG: NusA-like transcription termination signal-binding factor [Candidatus Aenigmarchaeota archaeon]|nr:NusA-like transcription termination signal-binding factor [Candidatus Aenigmarchaeota archaeon]MCX8190919.1 NusA-like transcription termination signal-binding factor [Candidatus Aenigmarchaeota archaeon]MDW8160112.1 NusA-like transcription termination signal-binding factor [Candidatus Aenigmarchaeota archaeon]
MAIVFDTEAIKMINLFESITHLSVKDCLIFEDVVYFLIEEGQKIENNGMVKTLENMMKKKIKVFTYNSNLMEFLRNSIRGAKDIKIRNEKEKKVIEITVDNVYKSLVIGKNGRNINAIRKILKRNYDVDEVVVR